MIDQQRIDEFVRYYSKFSAEERKDKHTSIGLYRPTAIDVLQELFAQLFVEGFLEPFDILIAAGGGDARVAALGALYQMRTYSIEGDPRIHALAEKRLEGLRREGVIDDKVHSNYPVLFCGDFLDMATYTRLRLRPEAVNIVCNGADNETALARLMKQHMQQKPAYLVLTQGRGTLVQRELFLAQTYHGRQGNYLGKVFSPHKC